MKYNEELALEIFKNRRISFAALDKWKKENRIPNKYKHDVSKKISGRDMYKWEILVDIMNDQMFNLNKWAELSNVRRHILYDRNSNPKIIPTEKELMSIIKVLFDKLSKLELLDEDPTEVIADDFFMWNRIYSGDGYKLKRKFLAFKRGERRSKPSAESLKTDIFQLIKSINEVKDQLV